VDDARPHGDDVIDAEAAAGERAVAKTVDEDVRPASSAQAAVRRIEIKMCRALTVPRLMSNASTAGWGSACSTSALLRARGRTPVRRARA
jgi:hypothetical protein